MSRIESRAGPIGTGLLALAALLPALAAPGASGRAAAAPPAATGNMARTALHQEAVIHAPPMRVYDALLDSGSFAAFTHIPARIEKRVGGATSLFGGLIGGRNIELVPGRRIVQAWRTTREWGPGVYSLVRFELRARGTDTLVILDQSGFPPGNYDHLNAGWGPRYWQPLDKFLTRR